MSDALSHIIPPPCPPDLVFSKLLPPPLPSYLASASDSTYGTGCSLSHLALKFEFKSLAPGPPLPPCDAPEAAHPSNL